MDHNGGFHAIMEMGDIIGSTVRLSDVQPMRQCMLHFQITIVKIVGRNFTRNNKTDAPDRVFTRIDRVLANSKWEDCFEDAEATFLHEEEFDHCPTILSTYKDDPQRIPFRFFNTWISSPRFLEIVEEHWADLSMDSLCLGLFRSSSA